MNYKEQQIYAEYCNLRMDWDKKRTLQHLYEKYRRELKENEINKIISDNEIHM